MHDLAEFLGAEYSVRINELELDLSENNAFDQCMGAIRELDCRLLVYVPAYSRIKPFSDNSSEELDRYIDLNSRTPLQLIHAFVNFQSNSLSSGIILVSSLAGIKGSKYIAPYSATKAFLILLAEGLFHELNSKGISILSCCAGMTDTPALRSTNPVIKNKWPGVADSMEVAESALKWLGKKPVCIAGWKNRLSHFLLTRLLTRRFATKIMAKAMEKMYPGIDPI
jgi:uncharacterized protein